MPAPSKNGIDYSIERFKSFVEVQKNNTKAERMVAVDHFAEAVGITPELWEHLTDELDEIIESPLGIGWAIVGILMGLFLAQYEEDL